MESLLESLYMCMSCNECHLLIWSNTECRIFSGKYSSYLILGNSLQWAWCSPWSTQQRELYLDHIWELVRKTKYFNVFLVWVLFCYSVSLWAWALQGRRDICSICFQGAGPSSLSVFSIDHLLFWWTGILRFGWGFHCSLVTVQTDTALRSGQNQPTLAHINQTLPHKYL